MQREKERGSESEAEKEREIENSCNIIHRTFTLNLIELHESDMKMSTEPYCKLYRIRNFNNNAHAIINSLLQLH